MSPTEDELRSALRIGEGGALDPDAVVRHARAEGAQLRERRVRLASAAAVVAVVAGLGIGGGFVLGRHTGSRSSGSSVDSAVRGGAGGAGSAGTGDAVGKAPDPGYSSSLCPVTLPQSSALTPDPQATFFSKPVARLLLCAYAVDETLVKTTDGAPITSTVDGAQAVALARSIERASRTILARPCPMYRTNQPTLLMRPTATDGSVLPDITTSALQNPCNSTITNGTAIRYNWSPTLLSSYVAELSKAAPTPRPQLPTHS